MSQINQEVKELCKKWDNRIQEYGNLEEGLPERQCKILLKRFYDESFQIIIDEHLEFEEIEAERQLVSDKSLELSIALNQANLRYRRKTRSFFEKLGELLPNSYFEKPSDF